MLLKSSNKNITVKFESFIFQNRSSSRLFVELYLTGNSILIKKFIVVKYGINKPILQYIAQVLFISLICYCIMLINFLFCIFVSVVF